LALFRKLDDYYTIEYLGIWEKLNNPSFTPLEFEGFLEQAGSNTSTLSPQKWVNSTNASGMFVRLGRSGGTFAHKDIAFKFAAERKYKTKHNAYKPIAKKSSRTSSPGSIKSWVEVVLYTTLFILKSTAC
jgi:hypothetical protein